MIESKTIDPLTSEEAKMEDMKSRMRGLASAVKNLQELDEWTMTSREASVPWGQITAAQSATGGIHQVGHISLSPNVYTTNFNQNLNTITGTSVNSLISGGNDYNMKVEQSGQIDVRGEKADIRINGKSMNKWMEQVEQRLNILTPNPELEKEWDDLRRLGERYRKLEKKCQEKARMWEALKKLPKVKP